MEAVSKESEFILKDSGKREEFPTGSRRDQRAGKGRFDLIPTMALRRLARGHGAFVECRPYRPPTRVPIAQGDV